MINIQVSIVCHMFKGKEKKGSTILEGNLCCLRKQVVIIQHSTD